ncbi:hypothetical protein CFS9_22380 [Flavobacterium sp. CFS9]|uniref:CAAX protease self-immunity n=1 Tax=Flavobacterium sp. CFS9 TaxID=3143118 RepID=A0AAT9H298_9FLAO
MTVALHGGLYEEMIYGISGGFVLAFLYFILTHYKVYKSEYYNEEYVYFSSGRKFFLYIGFLIVNLCVAYLLFFIFALIFAGISSYVIKNF